jgi:uncharacterized protein
MKTIASGLLADEEIAVLDALLAAVPPPLEPLDVAMLDGFLCGVLVQPRAIPESRWMPHATDASGRPLARGFDATRLHALVRRRHAELDAAIGGRQWFDPWVFDTGAGAAAVEPWVAGFASAMEWFPALLEGDSPALTEPLALLFRHLDANELEDADALLDEIASLEPPADLPAAIEEIVRATLLLADIGRPKRPRGRRSDR